MNNKLTVDLRNFYTEEQIVSLNEAVRSGDAGIVNTWFKDNPVSAEKHKDPYSNEPFVFYVDKVTIN